jgi:hypothetical protein
VRNSLINSPARAVFAFACTFALTQPVAYLLFHVVVARPRLLVTERDWVTFLVYVAALGAIAGLLWFFARSLPLRTWRRSWIEWGIPALSMGCLLEADILPTTPWFIWTSAVIIGAGLTGLLIGTVARFIAKSIHSSGAG